MARASAAKKSKSKSKASRKRSKLPARKKAKKSKSKVKAKVKAKKKKTKAKATKKKTKAKVAKKTSKKVARKPKAAKRVAKPVKMEQAVPETRPVENIENKIGVGDMAPDFQLPDENAQLHSLEQYRGKNLILYFYPKDDTPGCTKEACNFRDELPSFEGLNAVILGVSLDDQDSHQKFINKYNLNFHLLSDLDHKVSEEYGVYGEKNMYGKTYMGIERSTFVIDKEGRIAAAIRGVRVDGHNDELRAELEKLS